jgi:hypothetical protein
MNRLADHLIYLIVERVGPDGLVALNGASELFSEAIDWLPLLRRMRAFGLSELEDGFAPYSSRELAISEYAYECALDGVDPGPDVPKDVFWECAALSAGGYVPNARIKDIVRYGNVASSEYHRNCSGWLELAARAIMEGRMELVDEHHSTFIKSMIECGYVSGDGPPALMYGPALMHIARFSDEKTVRRIFDEVRHYDCLYYGILKGRREPLYDLITTELNEKTLRIILRSPELYNDPRLRNVIPPFAGQIACPANIDWFVRNKPCLDIMCLRRARFAKPDFIWTVMDHVRPAYWFDCLQILRDQIHKHKLYQGVRPAEAAAIWARLETQYVAS